MPVKRFLLLCIMAALMAPGAASAQEPTTDTTVDRSVAWFPGLALAVQAGSAWLETATSDEFRIKPTIGGQLMLDVLSTRQHVVVLDLGYVFLFGTDHTGTREVSVSTSYHRIHATLGYDFRYKVLIVGGRLGAAGMMFKTVTELWKSSHEVIGGQLVFNDGQIIGFRKDIGIDFGLMGRVELGLDLTRLLGGPSSVAELRLRADLVRRGEREEYFAGLVMVFRPTSLF